MFRTVCLFATLALLNLAVSAQSTLPVKPNGFPIPKSSALRTLSTKDSGVTPASFLRIKQEESKPGASASDERIPSILTGRKSSTPTRKVSSASRTLSNQDEIDPLNIPSKPITPGKQTSSSAPSTFSPPKSTQFMPSSSTQPKAANSGFQPNSGFRPQGNSATSNSTANIPALNNTTRSNTTQGNLTPRTGQTPNLNGNPRSTSAPRINAAPSGLTAPRSTSTQESGVRSAPGNRPVPSTNQIPASPRSSNAINSVPRVANSSYRNSQPVNRSINRTPNVKPDSFVDQQLNPVLKVLSTGPKTIAVNKEGKFEIKVVNLGQVDANDVMVGIQIPAWVDIIGKPDAAGGEAVVKDLGDGKGIVWNLSYLPAGRDALISLNLEPKQNRAFNLKTEWTTAPVSGESKVLVTQANLETRISGPTEVQYGQKAVYTITIENTGNGIAEKVNVALSESLGGDSATVGFIEAGSTKQFEVELTAGQAGAMKLEAFVRGDAGVKSEIAKEIVVRRAKLVVKANGPKFKYAGSALTYNISVENQGDAPARNINAAALLPLNAEYISGLDQIGENDGRKVGWKISEIPAGSKRDFIITCLVSQAGEARMEIGVRSEDGLTGGNVVSTKVEALADLKLEVVDPRGPQPVGREVTYELHIKNRGTKAAQNVIVSGEFSDFIDPVAGRGAKANLEKGGIIAFDPIPQIKVGESVVIKVVAKAYQPGTHTFRAIVNCKEQDIRKISEGTTKFFGEGISKPNSRPAKQPQASLPSVNQPSANLPSTNQTTTENGNGGTTQAAPTTGGSLPPTSFQPANSGFQPTK